MNEAQLRSCYEGLKGIHEGLERYEVVRAVEEYRHYWRPKTVKVVLLAESHVFTSKRDYLLKLPASELLPRHYPDRFVRFVYCLGYGEPDLLDRRPAASIGTPHFWKIFLSCLTRIKATTDFATILRTKTPDLEQRLRNKCQALQRLQQRGIWLVDASVTGLYCRGRKPPLRIYKKVIEHCWDHYVGELLAEARPSFIICVGKTVETALGLRLYRKYARNLEVVPQPNARLSSHEHLEVFGRYFDICERYAL